MVKYDERAREIFQKLFGNEAENIKKMLNKLSPEIENVVIDFPFGEFYAKDDLLDLKTRELVTISTLVTQGTLPQLKLHIKAAMNAGCSVVEIEQTMFQLIAYIGIPKVLNALTVLRETVGPN